MRYRIAVLVVTGLLTASPWRGFAQDTPEFPDGVMTREQWQQAASAWHRWGTQLEDWLGEATELMLDLAGVRSGSRVLDVAAGAGGQTLAAARRTGAEGRVLATDIAPAILEHAVAEARAAGLVNVAAQVADG